MIPDVTADPELVERIATSTGLSPAEAARVVEDVVAFHAEPVEDYVRRRHAAAEDLRREEPRDLRPDRRRAGRPRRRRARPLSERQLRRIVYG